MLGKKSFKILLGVTLVALIVIMVLFILPEAIPDFGNRSEPLSFAEMLEEPPSFINGTSIDIWLYTDNEGILREIADTGHAETRTCRLISGLLFNTYLRKYEEPEDFCVAGAGRLVNKMNKLKLKEIEKNQMVSEYREMGKMIHLYNFLLNKASEKTTLDETERTAISRYEAQIETLKEQIANLEKSLVIQDYKRHILSGHEFVRFSEELAKIVESSGLVQVHKIPYGIVDDVKNRITNSVEHKNKKSISFEDLLAKYNIGNAVVWVDVLQLTNGKPLEIEIPIAHISYSSFEEVRIVNRNQLELTMIGDARRRIRFFKEQKDNIDDQKKYYSMINKQEIIELDSKISPDGLLVKLPESESEKITVDEYLRIRIPKLIKYVDSLIEETENIVAEIETDKKRKDESKIEILNHMTLIDSLLRDWDLPVPRSQAAFDIWRKKQRTPTWRRIIQELKKNKIRVAGLDNENTVFSVKLNDKNLVIRPLQILDLSNSVLILDTDSNITRVESTWNYRKLIRKKETSGDSMSISKQRWQNINDIFSNLPGRKAKNSIIRNLNLYPNETLEKLELFQRQVSPEYNMYFAKILKKISPLKWKKNFLNDLKKLNESPTSKEEPFEYLDNLFQLLKSYPSAPVDIYLTYAFHTSGIIAYIINENYKDDEQFKPLTAWDVVQKCEKEEFTYLQGIKRQYLEKIRETILVVRKRDSGYYDMAEKMGSIPEIESEEYKKFYSDLNDEFSLFEVNAMDYEELRSNLITRSYAMKAAIQLYIKSKFESSVELDPIINQIEKAMHWKNENDESINPIFANAKERLVDFKKSYKSIDTLAQFQIANQIEVGCDLILKKLNELPKRIALPSYSALIARMYYEMGEYKNAFDTLFNSQTSIALYHPQLYWERLEGDWVGYPMNVKADLEKGQIVVMARDKKEKKRVLKILGIPEKEAKSLCKKINELKNDAWNPIGKVSDQILMTQVPVRDELKRLHELFVDDTLKLAILKTMAYLELPPAYDIVPPAVQDKLNSNESKRYDRIGIGKIQSVVVPSLEELRKIVESRYR